MSDEERARDELTPMLRRRLRILGDALPTLQAPDFQSGRWHDSERLQDGVRTMPWYELSPAAEAYLRAVGEAGWLRPDFDWPTWSSTPESIALRTDREALAAATPEQLARLLTMLIREDRFTEGALAGSFDSGLMAAIARRAAALANGPETGPDVAAR